MTVLGAAVPWTSKRHQADARPLAVAAGFVAAGLVGFAYVFWVLRLDLRTVSCRPPWELTGLSFLPFGAFSAAIGPMFLTARSITARRSPTVVASFAAASLILLALTPVAFVAYMSVGVDLACD
jgi:hypothetical protein